MLVSMNFSSQSFCPLTWFHIFTLFLLVSFSSSSSVSYSPHCNSIIAESTPSFVDDTAHPLLQTSVAYFTGGDTLFSSDDELSFNSKRSLSFRNTRNVYRTDTDGVYKIQALLIFEPTNMYYASNFSYDDRTHHHRTNFRFRPLRFLFKGFWSESAGNLCMVGSAVWYSKEGKRLNLNAVLKLNYAKNSTIFTSLVNGTLESLSSSSSDLRHFKPISILAVSSVSQYKNTLDHKVFDEGFSREMDLQPKSSLSLQHRELCSMISSRFNTFELEYASKCNPSVNCSPFSSDVLPSYMSLYAIHCYQNDKSLQFLLEFQNDSSVDYNQPFNPSTTLVGEGLWDPKRNRLFVVACRILNLKDSLRNAYVGDCSIRLSLRIPAVWSIGNTSSVIGHIWTNKTATDSGFFDRIKFESYDTSMIRSSRLKYEYTLIDRVRASCPVGKPERGKKQTYPNRNSYELRFDMSVQAFKKKFAWGYATPLFVGDELFEKHSVVASTTIEEDSLVGLEKEGLGSVVEANASYSGPSNISYTLSFSPLFGVKWPGALASLNYSNSKRRVEISAEGIYDEETGKLCMVGCRKLNLYAKKTAKDSLDCEILVNFQFPAADGKSEGWIKGSVRSTRKRDDPLYFEHLNISANAFYSVEVKQSIWRMDTEIIMVLISNTLACLFVLVQIFHVKRRPDVLPLISILMLVILTIGQMIPLVLNFEALLLENHGRQNSLLESGGWLEVNEVIVRAVTMVAFLLQFRLLQLAWSARRADTNQRASWAAEIKALTIALPLYIMGILLSLFVNWLKKKYGDGGYGMHSLWTDLRSYGGLILDGFLLPQILHNIFLNSREKALSCFFYSGTTLVRLVPHGYDFYRAHNYVFHRFRESYIYANPKADFYSTAWDIIIPCGGILFAVVIYLQQRLGGRCVLPRRCRELQMYEKVPVVVNN